MELLQYGILGLGLGALYSLASQGLILIYRGSGVLNFAHGAIGMAGAYVWWQVTQIWGAPFLVGLVAGVGAGALLGALVHLLVMRHLRRASPLTRVVATLGVLITLEAAATLRYGAQIFDTASWIPSNPIHLGSIVVSSDRLYLLAIAVALTAGLWVLYRRTRFGLATAAVAENERVAASMGWSPDTIATVNWALGSALAALAAILIVPIVTLQVSSLTTLVLAAMACALVASFNSFPVALGAALVLGIVQTELERYSTQPGLYQSVPFVVIALVLIVRGRSLPLRDYLLQRLPAVGDGRIRPGLLAFGVAVTAILLATTPVAWKIGITTSLAAAVIGVSIVVLTGFAGQLSLAQFAIAGFGAWAAWEFVGTVGLPFWLGVPMAVLAAAGLGLVFGLPSARTRGVSYAVITLGLGTALELMLFDNSGWTGGLAGANIPPPSLFGWDVNALVYPERFGFVALAVFVLAGLVAANVRRGRTGRRLIAVRTNERAAAALGISPVATKLYACALAAALAAVGGILLAFQSTSLTFSTFTNFTSITLVGYAVVSGVGWVTGSIFASTFFVGGVGTVFISSIAGSLTSWITLAGGVLTIVLILRNQDGLAKAQSDEWSKVRQRWKRRFPPRRARAVPASAGLPSDGQDRQLQVPGRKLELRDVSVHYGGTQALSHVSVVVRPGRIVGLIGPNGAGKTTLIDAVTGFAKPATGQVLLDGQVISGWPAVKRARSGLSRSFQALELFDDLTVIDNLRSAADPRDLLSSVRDLVYPVNPGLSDAAVAAIREFGLQEDLGRRAQDLPYARRRLLAIARAVATRPSVLLLDEPAAGLSEVETAELARLVRRLATDWGMAILLIEHDMSFVMRTCDEVAVLDFGKKIAHGTPAQVRSDPAVIAAYLGEPEPEQPNQHEPQAGDAWNSDLTEERL
jgi:ABC-type branched-subunit amino acid transport system ATPase component/branched-subunit amino acid ABC-type transport system permease component